MNVDIFHRVIEFIEPNPVVYMRLSRVSKYYYTLFTSDKRWEPLNVYNLESAIYQHFIKSERVINPHGKIVWLSPNKAEFRESTESAAIRAWRDASPIPDSNRKTPYSEMRYAWLGFLMHRDTDHPLPNTFSMSREDEIQFMKRLVRLRPAAMTWARHLFSNSKEFALAVVSKCGGALEYFDEHIRGDREVVRRAVSTGCICSMRSLGSPGYYRLHERHDTPFKYASQTLQEDRELARYAVENNWRALKHAPLELRNDPDTVLVAFKQSFRALEYCKYKTRDLVLAAVREEGDMIQYGREYGDDAEIMMIAVTNCSNVYSSALYYASQALRRDRELVLAAVNHRGSQIEYAEPELKSDREIVLAAVKSDRRALRYASSELRNDRPFLIECIVLNERVFDIIKNFGPFGPHTNLEFLKQAIESNPKVIFHLSNRFKKNRELIVYALEKDGRLLVDHRRPMGWCRDKELVNIARKTFPEAVERA